MLRRFYLVLAVSFLIIGTSMAQSNSQSTAKATEREPAREKVITDQLQAIAPSAVADFKAGTAAMDSGDFPEAARLFDAVRLKAPSFDHVLRRLGTSLVLQGKVDEGMDLIEQAVGQNRSPENLISLAGFLARPAEDKQGTRDQKWRAYSLALEADQKQTTNDPDYMILLADLAAEFDQLDIFRRATEKLVATHPELTQTHYFSALLAAHDEKWMAAEKEIRKAQSLGLSPEAVQAFLDSGVRTQARIWRYSLYALWAVVLWILGLGLLFVLGKLMSKRTLRAIEESDPNMVASNSDLSLRKWYRRLINIAGVYYYISMPIVMLLVLGLAAALTYLSFAIGQIPIKLIIIVCVGAVVTVYKMIRSLLLKIEREDPGRSLNQAEAPGLWELTKKVAAALNTRPVDEIRVTPGTDLAVYERGSFREKSGDQAQRILILGVGVLNDFPLNGFRAVLAHEYGHFSHRDTAGGDVALRVNDDMLKFAHAMITSRQNVWWNVAFHFLRIYHFIFRRISRGATRLQEVLADRAAAARYGALAFEEGLKHVIRKDAEFGFLANREINESAGAQRALQNLYELPINPNPDIDQATEQTLNRETSEDDTHPSPNDRFRLTKKIVSQSEPPISGMVWDLFADRAALTGEMTALIQQQLRN